MPGGSMTSKPAWSNICRPVGGRVFRHVGFFRFRWCVTAAMTKHEPWINSRGRTIMYIGGGLLTLVIVVVVVVLLLRR